MMPLYSVTLEHILFNPRGEVRLMASIQSVFWSRLDRLAAGKADLRSSLRAHRPGVRNQSSTAVNGNVASPDRRLVNCLLAGAILAGAALMAGAALKSRPLGSIGPRTQGPAQSHSAFPVDIVAGPAPEPVMAHGRARLLYELRVTNFSVGPIELLGLDVLGANGTPPLASYRGEALEKLLLTVGPADGANKPRIIGGG